MQKTKLSQHSKQSISTMLMNFISTIPSDEEIEISFSATDIDGKSHISLEAVKKSKTPDIERVVTLKDFALDVKINTLNGKEQLSTLDKHLLKG